MGSPACAAAAIGQGRAIKACHAVKDAGLERISGLTLTHFGGSMDAGTERMFWGWVPRTSATAANQPMVGGAFGEAGMARKGEKGAGMAVGAASVGLACPLGDRGEEGRMRGARRSGISGDSILQVGLALLCVILSALAWSQVLDVFAGGG